MAKDKWGFKRWAPDYDRQVAAASPTDDWMFGGYDRVLDRVAACGGAAAGGDITVLDIGVGTGNLAARFLKHGIEVYGTDPSAAMLKICRRKYPGVRAMTGDFLKYPRRAPPADVIVSAYAFHHLTGSEKAAAVRLMKQHLKPGGRAVIADFMFKNAAGRESTARAIRERSGGDILDAFKDEYPGLYEDIAVLFQNEGFAVDGEQLTESVWLVRARL